MSPIPEQDYHWKESENLSMLISAAVCVSVCMSICLFASDSMTPAKLWGFEKQKWHPIPRTGFYTTKRKEAGHIKYFSQSIPIHSSFLSTVMPCFICSLFPTLSFFSFTNIHISILGLLHIVKNSLACMKCINFVLNTTPQFIILSLVDSLKPIY